MSYYGDFPEVYIKLYNFSLPGFRKRAVLFLNDSKSKKIRGKTGNSSLESQSQILEETRRIQDLVQFTGKYQNIKDS